MQLTYISWPCDNFGMHAALLHHNAMFVVRNKSHYWYSCRPKTWSTSVDVADNHHDRLQMLQHFYVYKFCKNRQPWKFGTSHRMLFNINRISKCIGYWPYADCMVTFICLMKISFTKKICRKYHVIITIILPEELGGYCSGRISYKSIHHSWSAISHRPSHISWQLAQNKEKSKRVRSNSA